MINLLGFIPGSSLLKGLIVAAVVAATVGAVGYAVHSYNDSLREEGRAEVRAEVVKADFMRSEKALEASQAARVKESGFRVSLQRIQNDLVKEKAASAVAAAAVADGLRNLEIALAVGGGPGSDPASPGRITNAGTEGELLGQCARQYRDMAGEAQRLKEKLIGLQGYVTEVCLN